MKNNNIRTDLAIELRENLQDASGADIPGVQIQVEQDENHTVTWVEITDKTGAEAMGKPIGNYITLESDAMKENAPEMHEEIVKVLAVKLGRLHNLSKDAVILIIGLGNRHVTPDALGPKVCDKLLVTRHIGDAVPQELIGKLRDVCAISPGVMGITGIETAEIAKGVVDRVKPDLIIAIDALAARATHRINSTIQISDTGINPGAGMGNRRLAINEKSMGVPVIAVGVPTVVDAATLINDTMDKLLDAMVQAAPEGEPFYNTLVAMGQDGNRYGIITEILSPDAGNMFVTPKEVDAVIERLSKIVANMLNIALHPGVTTEDINRYIEAV